jgi:hypothetical protein
MAVSWDSHVNTDVYGQDGGYNDNRETVAYKSGRKVYYRKNTRDTKTHALNLSVNDSTKVDGKTEFQWFLYWYENTIKSGTVPFSFTDVITHTGTTVYYLSDTPTWKGQKTKEISMKFEEA